MSNFTDGNKTNPGSSVLKSLSDKVKSTIKACKVMDSDSQDDVLELLGHLEGELQARDVVIAALKSEQLKRLVNCYAGVTGSVDEPISALTRDTVIASSSSCIPENPFTPDSAIVSSLRRLVSCQKSMISNYEKQLNPNDASTQPPYDVMDVYNTVEEDFIFKLEKERLSLKLELEAETRARLSLESELRELCDDLKQTKLKQRQMILFLLSDRQKLCKMYNEEAKRSRDLASLLASERLQVQAMANGLEEESQRSLRLEADLACLQASRPKINTRFELPPKNKLDNSPSTRTEQSAATLEAPTCRSLSAVTSMSIKSTSLSSRPSVSLIKSTSISSRPSVSSIKSTSISSRSSLLSSMLKTSEDIDQFNFNNSGSRSYNLSQQTSTMRLPNHKASLTGEGFSLAGGSSSIPPPFGGSFDVVEKF